MEVKNVEEFGYEWALKGMSYSYLDEAVDVDIWWEQQKPKAIKRSTLLSVKTPEHSKFLRFMEIYADVRATRAFFQEFDTYKFGVERLSASTMHKLDKREPIISDFSENTPKGIIHGFISEWQKQKESGKINITILKDSLPEGYLQTRAIKLNYTALRNIISQRKGHRYKYWDIFIEQLVSQLEHPELVEDLL